MNVVNQICTREQAEELYRLGLMQSSLLYHYHSPAHSGDGWAVGTATDAAVFNVNVFGASKDFFSAYNTAELGAMLLKETRWCYYYELRNVWGCDKDGMHHSGKTFSTQAQAYADFLIWLMQTNRIKYSSEFISTRLEKFLTIEK